MAACSATLLPSTTKCSCACFEPLKWDSSKCGACLHDERSHHTASEHKQEPRKLRKARIPRKIEKSQEWLKDLDIAHTMDVAKIEQIFNTFDQDKNGYLDRDEARQFVQQWCLQLGSHEAVNVTQVLEHFFATFDADKAELLGTKTVDAGDLLPPVAHPELLLQPSKTSSDSLLDIETKTE